MIGGQLLAPWIARRRRSLGGHRSIARVWGLSRRVGNPLGCTTLHGSKLGSIVLVLLVGHVLIGSKSSQSCQLSGRNTTTLSTLSLSGISLLDNISWII